MKKYLSLIFLLTGIVAASGCIGDIGNKTGNVVNETKEVSGFNQVFLEGLGTLIITQGKTESLTIEADDSMIDHIKTSVSNNKLTISYINNPPVPTKPVKFHLTVKNLNSIEISGAGKVNSNNLKVNSMNLSLTGAAEGKLTNFQAKTFVLIISGAGIINASGKVNSQTITLNGAGKYNAPSLLSQSTSVTINGAGKSTVNATKTLNAIINGAGQVNYFGNPQLTQEIHGSGEINHVVH